jgi:carbohydrate-selective porin OprB
VLRPNRKAYALASADLFFTAKLAQYTSFFADVVALSGAPPDREIPSLTLLNGYTARLVNQNELNLREAWLRTEFFGQRLALTAGRLDLTNYFDRNTAANDETTQFLSDALVNNQMLGLASNGTGLVADIDPKNGFSFRVGVQQSNPDATSLSDSIYSLAEVGYTMTPFSLPEGHYRIWYRANNGAVDSTRAVGFSIDQKLSPVVTLFGRYGTQNVPGDRDHYTSAGVSFSNGLVFNPLDSWGIGYAQMDLASGDKEKLTEGYYNLRLTERLRLSFSVQHVLDAPGSDSKFGYLLPGVRLQAAF